MKRFFTLFAILVGVSPIYAQQLDDYRTSSTGNVTVNMESETGWQRWNGTTWVNAITAPDDFAFADGNTIAIETGDTWNMNSDVIFSSNDDFNIIVRGIINSTGGGSPYNFDYGTGNTTVTIVRTTNQNFNDWFEGHNFANLVLEGSGSFEFGGTGLNISNSLTLTNVNLIVSDFNTNNTTLAISANGNITVENAQALNNSTINASFTGNNRTFLFNGPLTLSNNSTINATFEGTAAQDGDFTINDVDLTLTNSTINIYGQWADLNHTEGGGGGGSDDISLNNSSINLLGPDQVFDTQGSITFSNNSRIQLLGDRGNLTLDNNENFTGANASNYVALGSTSTVSRAVNDNYDAPGGGTEPFFLFPIGTASNYLPVSIDPQDPSTNRTYTVGVFENATTDAQPGGTLAFTPPIVNAVWKVAATLDGTNNKTVNARFGWSAALEGTQFAALPNTSMGIAQYDNSTNTWPLATAGTSPDNTANALTSNGVIIAPGQTVSFAISQVGFTLPVTTRNFTAAPYNNQVKLDWIASATHMNSYFEVERSSNGKDNFQKIATIQVKTVGEAKYNYLDASPLKPEGYYRIRIVDENLRVTYTKTLKVSLGGSHFSLDNLFPTVATSQLNLLISSSRQNQAQINIIDQSGRIVVMKNLNIVTGSQTYQLDVNSLGKGMYFLQIRKGDEVLNSRFIKQ